MVAHKETYAGTSNKFWPHMEV